MSKLDSFDPGENLVLYSTPRRTSPKCESVVVRFPGRIHVTPIDCNRFDFGKAGGGGMGFAVEMDNRLHMRVSTRDVTTGEDIHKPLLHHYMALIKRLFIYDGGLEVKSEISNLMLQHFGLGSSVAIATACMQGANVLFESPLPREEIRRLVASNFVEVYNGRLCRGLETGVGTYVILNGGLAIIADEIVPLYSTSTLNGLPVVLVVPAATRPEAEKPESLEMLQRSLVLDSSYRYTRAYRMVMDIVPALDRDDLRSVGDVIWDFQFSGTHQSMIQAYQDGGLEIVKTLTILRKAGGTIVGMSSVGPAIYVVCKDPTPVLSVISDAKLPYHLTRVSARGVEVSEHT
jgi:predicted sugar kinase